jgi:hypothetical protein
LKSNCALELNLTSATLDRVGLILNDEITCRRKLSKLVQLTEPVESIDVDWSRTMVISATAGHTVGNNYKQIVSLRKNTMLELQVGFGISDIHNI